MCGVRTQHYALDVKPVICRYGGAHYTPLRLCRVLAVQALAFACPTNVARQAVGHASLLSHSFWREVHDDQVHVSGFGAGQTRQRHCIVQCDRPADAGGRTRCTCSLTETGRSVVGLKGPLERASCSPLARSLLAARSAYSGSSLSTTCPID